MSDEKQLTVAELLAKNRRSDSESGGGGRPARRRRRSLEEGGISVAELTGSVPRVNDKPAESRHSSVPLDAPVAPRSDAPKRAEVAADAAVEPEHQAEAVERETGTQRPEEAEQPRPSEDETAVIQRVTDDADAAEKEGTRPAGTRGAAALAAYPAKERGAEAPEEPEASEERDEPAEDATADAAPEAKDDEDDDFFGARDDAEEDEEHGGMGSVLLLAVLGVVLGAVLFVVFAFLWGSQIPNGVVALFALVVTCVLVGVVHLLRTANDKMSMVLSGVAGVLMTFGPAVPVLFA